MENLKQTYNNSAKLLAEQCTLFLAILTNIQGEISNYLWIYLIR